MRATRLSHHIFLELITLIICGKEILKPSSFCSYLFTYVQIFSSSFRSPVRWYLKERQVAVDSNVPPTRKTHFKKSWGNKLYGAEFNKSTRIALNRKTRKMWRSEFWNHAPSPRSKRDGERLLTVAMVTRSNQILICS
jgi:hypothetical protein